MGQAGWIVSNPPRFKRPFHARMLEKFQRIGPTVLHKRLNRRL